LSRVYNDCMARFLLIFACFLLPVVTFAEIANPYVVDFKSQVMFGDSTATSTYQGLENYTIEYVSGYLHITFTYTHHFTAFSDYSPRIYITAVDPTATTTPTERDRSILFQLPSFNLTYPTDWYWYDVQFDATGYTFVMKEAGVTQLINEHINISGITDTDYAALANLYPSQGNSFSMAFTPLVILGDTTAPSAPVVTSPASSSATTTLSIILSGTAEATSTISVLGGLGTATTTTNGTGSWSLALSLNQNALNNLNVTATDSANNTSSSTSFIITHDNTAPIITLTGDRDMSVFNTNGYSEPGFSVSDNLDTSLVTSTSGSVNINTAGNYYLTYLATDDAGNAASTTRVVRVIVTEAATSGSSGGNVRSGGGGSSEASTGSALSIVESQSAEFTQDSSPEPDKLINLSVALPDNSQPIAQPSLGALEANEASKAPQENVAIALEPINERFNFRWEWLAILSALIMLTGALYSSRRRR